MGIQVSSPDQFDIVYFSSIDWNHTWQRPQQLASRLARYGKVLYISPLGLRSVVLTDWARILRRIAFEFSRRAAASNQHMTVHTPLLYLPLPESPLANRINGRLLHRSIAQWMKRQQVHQPIIWIGTPSLADLEAIQDVDARLIVYDCLDNFPLFHKDPYRIIEAEQQIVSRANIVFATATELYDRMKPVKPQHTFLVPNAADYVHFAAVTTQSFECPEDLVGIRKPLLGYFGEMAHWFDFNLIYDIALRHPEWTFALIGAVHVAVDKKLLGLPNVRFLGRKDYAKLPAYLSQFEVCLLPFKINALTSAVNPVKLYEYLAAGKPVVSTPLKEVLRYQKVVEIADRTKFADAIELALVTSRDPQRVFERQQVAQQNTWDVRIEEIIRILCATKP